MKKSLLLSLACLLFLASTSAFAITSPCANSTLDTYLVPTFACTINNLTFTNWNYQSTSNLASNISVGVLASPPQGVFPDPPGSGFSFSTNWTANGGGVESQDSLILFAVTSTTTNITDLHLAFNGATLNGGQATVIEQYCLGQTNGNPLNCSGPGFIAGNIAVTSPGTTFESNAIFSAVSAISVSKDIGVQSTHATNSIAHISTVLNNFSTSSSSVPEPGTINHVPLVECPTNVPEL